MVLVLKEIEEVLEILWEEAGKARSRAYVPYSGFAVGAALYTASGQIFTGCNVENGSYGLTQCAERVALGVLTSQGGDQAVALAVQGPPGRSCSPCGACRQVLLEHNPKLRVWFWWEGRRVGRSIPELLPEAFLLED